jgi:Holliday junction DNA helicase RuvA
MLKKVPGIGVKSANRILMELSDFTIESNSSSRSNIEAVMALESLGFKKEMILKALLNESGDTSTLIKKALKKLSKV